MISIIFLSRLNQINYELYIPELLVEKNYQKHGIGKKLIKSCIEIAREKNVIELGSNQAIKEKIRMNFTNIWDLSNHHFLLQKQLVKIFRF